MSSQVLRPQSKLHYAWEYRLFFGHSQIIRLSEMIVFRIPNQLAYPKLGITIKARGSSVNRNKLKRYIREFFRTHTGVLGPYSYNFVIPSSKKLQHPYPRQLRKCLLEELTLEIQTPPPPFFSDSSLSPSRVLQNGD